MRTSDPRPGTRPGPPAGLADALTRLETRWGTAAVRLGNGDAARRLGADRSDPGIGVAGALATVPEVDVEAPLRRDPLAPLPDDVVSTGFPALDAILGPGGLPRQASAVVRGDVSSGKTTLALRCLAEAQARGGIAAYLDLAGSFDPLEAVARGVDLRWLVILRPVDAGEGFALAGALLAGRTIDLLVIDLPPDVPGTHDAIVRRLAAHARRVGACLLVLEPISLRGPLHGALTEATGLRLELERRAWIRLGRDVVGQWTGVTVAKNRFGMPGRSVELEIRYADDGDRAAGVARLLDQGDASAPRDARQRVHSDRWPVADRAPAPPLLRPLPPPSHMDLAIDDASPPPGLAPSSPPTPAPAARPVVLPGRAAHPRRAAVGAGERHGREPGRAPPGRPPRPAAGERP